MRIGIIAAVYGEIVFIYHAVGHAFGHGRLRVSAAGAI